MKKNVFLLALCQALLVSSNALLVATSALVGLSLAENKALATLPLALQSLAAMLMTIPASLLMKRFGRRPGFIAGALAGGIGAVIGTLAIVSQSFLLFSLSAVLLGGFNGFASYYRFAAADVVNTDYRGKAISFVLAGGVIAAFIGPNLADWSQGLFATSQFAGSYAALGGLYVATFIVLLFLKIPPPTLSERQDSGRPLVVIARHPAFIVAVLCGVIGFGIMNMIMTAAPLTIKQLQAYTFSDIAFVIQWHIFAMSAPAFVTGHIIKRFGINNVLLAGGLLMVLSVVTNIAATTTIHFWLGLILLGIGWNFLFIGGSTLLTDTYTPAEKAKSQAFNDFLVMGSATLTTLGSGALYHYFGWQAVNMGVLPLILVVLLATLWQRKYPAPVPA